MTQQVNPKFAKLPTCQNRTTSKYDDNRVFCSRTNDWVNSKCCLKCSPKKRERAEQEW